MFYNMKKLWKAGGIALLSFLFATGTKASPADDAMMGVQAIYGVSVETPDLTSPKEVFMRLLFPIIGAVLFIAAIIPVRRFILRRKEKRTRIILWILLALLLVLALFGFLIWIGQALYWA